MNIALVKFLTNNNTFYLSVSHMFSEFTHVTLIKEH